MARCRWFKEFLGSEVVLWFIAHVQAESSTMLGSTVGKNEIYLLQKQLDEIEVTLHFHALGAELIVLTREHIMVVSRLKDLPRVSTTVNVDSVVDGSGWLSCVSGRKHSCLRSASLFPQRVTSTTSLWTT